MNIKVQSESISFKEFAEEHPNSSILVPDSHGIDGMVLFQILLPFALEVVKDVIGYIAKKIIEKKEQKGKTTEKPENIIFILKGGYAVRIPISDFENTDNVYRRIEEAIGKIND